MQAYLARLNGEQKNPREIVGVFFAENLIHLHEMIDECCDVDCVEVMELGPGGIYWSSAVDYVVPYPKDQRENAQGLPGDATVTDGWLGALFDENEEEWQQAELV